MAVVGFAALTSVLHLVGSVGNYVTAYKPPTARQTYHGIPWYTMAYQTLPWYTMAYHGIPWYTMAYHGIPCYTWLRPLLQGKLAHIIEDFDASKVGSVCSSLQWRDCSHSVTHCGHPKLQLVPPHGCTPSVFISTPCAYWAMGPAHGTGPWHTGEGQRTGPQDM